MTKNTAAHTSLHAPGAEEGASLSKGSVESLSRGKIEKTTGGASLIEHTKKKIGHTLGVGLALLTLSSSVQAGDLQNTSRSGGEVAGGAPTSLTQKSGTQEEVSAEKQAEIAKGLAEFEKQKGVLDVERAKIASLLEKKQKNAADFDQITEYMEAWIRYIHDKDAFMKSTNGAVDTDAYLAFADEAVACYTEASTFYPDFMKHIEEGLKHPPEGIFFDTGRDALVVHTGKGTEDESKTNLQSIAEYWDDEDPFPFESAEQKKFYKNWEVLQVLPRAIQIFGENIEIYEKTKYFLGNKKKIEEIDTRIEKIKGEREKIKGEREKIKGEREKIKGEREKIKGEREKIKGEREKIKGKREKIKGEREKIKKETEEIERKQEVALKAIEKNVPIALGLWERAVKKYTSREVMRQELQRNDDLLEAMKIVELYFPERITHSTLWKEASQGLVRPSERKGKTQK